MEDDENEMTDAEFLRKVAYIIFHSGLSQHHIDRLDQIASEMEDMGWTK